MGAANVRRGWHGKTTGKTKDFQRAAQKVRRNDGKGGRWMARKKTVDRMDAPEALPRGEGARADLPAENRLYWDADRRSVIVSSRVAAMYFGVTVQTVTNWAKDGCPRVKYGYYDLRELLEYRARKEGLLDQQDSETDVDKMSIKAQKTYFEKQLRAAQAEAAQLRTGILRGDYLERGRVVSDLKRWAIVLKRSLTGLGKAISREVATALDPAEARRFDARISEVINEALEQLAVERCYHDER